MAKVNSRTYLTFFASLSSSRRASEGSPSSKELRGGHCPFELDGLLECIDDRRRSEGEVTKDSSKRQEQETSLGDESEMKQTASTTRRRVHKIKKIISRQNIQCLSLVVYDIRPRN